MGTPLLLLLLAASFSGGEPRSSEPLRSIAEILALPAEGLRARPAAVVEGVVTLSVPRMMVIQDGDAALFVSGPEHVDGLGDFPQVPLGSRIELSGQVLAGGYSPTLLADRGRLLGQGDLPEPQPANLPRLFRGGDVGLRVVVRGVVQGVGDRGLKCWTLVVDTDMGHLIALFPRAGDEPPPHHFIDAEVRMTGIVGAIHNSRGEFIAPEMTVVATDDVEIVKPPVSDPFALPLVPLPAIARYRPDCRSSHRLHTAGTVAYAATGLLFITAEEAGVRVELAANTAAAAPAEPEFAAGDRVDVVGFLDMTRSIGGLTGAHAVRTGTGGPPQAVAVRLADIRGLDTEFRKTSWMTEPGSFDGRLVRCVGRVEAVETTPDGLEVTLAAEGTHWFAEIAGPAAAAAARRLAVESDVEITGILRVDLQAARVNGLVSGHPATGRIVVLARNADDVAVIRPAPWWTPRRLAIASLGLMVALVAATAGAVLLGREVRRQATALADTLRSQREATIEFEAALRERNRLAANLHDTVLQTVTGIGYQLQVCAAAPPSGNGLGTLQVARRMVSHAVDQLRGTVWALHSLPSDHASLVTGLASRIERLREGFETPVRCAVVGLERPVAPTVAANLLLVAQEAVVNALRHAAATKVDVTVEFGSDAVTLTVRDDGRGFPMGDQPGALYGHFGIEGMFDRMQAVNGECRVESRPGQGTVVTAVAPSGAAEDDLSDRTGGMEAGCDSIPA